MRRVRYLVFVVRMVLVGGWVRGASLLRRLVGLPPLAHPWRRLLARHWQHLLRLRPVRQLTVGDFAPREGGGSRALMTIYAIAYCRRYGFAYRHTPMVRTAHAERDQSAFDAAWEKELNFGDGEVPAASRCDPAVFDLWELLIEQTASGPSLLDQAEPYGERERAAYYSFIDRDADPQQKAAQQAAFVDLLTPVLPEIRARYRQHRRRVANSAFAVAVHIRRGDVSPERTDMWSEAESYVATLCQLVPVLQAAGVEPEITVYSQGSSDALAALAPHVTRIACDTDPIDTFRQLADADLLVMGKSCFSHVAALLGDGIVLYEPWSVPPLPAWLVREPGGSFDTSALALRVQQAGLSLPRP